MAVYVLMWPAIVLVMMAVMGAGLYRDMRAAKRSGDELV